jgi:hypothetical protein
VAEAAAQSLTRPAPRVGQLAALFGLGVLAAAAVAAALWLSGALEPAARDAQPVPAAVTPAVPADSPALFTGEPLPLRVDDTLPGARAAR